MKWLWARRRAILVELREGTHIGRLAEWLSTSSCHGGRLTQADILVSGDRVLSDFAVLFTDGSPARMETVLIPKCGRVLSNFTILVTEGTPARVETALVPKFRAFETRLTACVVVVPPLESGTIEVCIIDFVIALPISKRHSFLTRPESKSRLFGTPRGKKIPRSEPFPPPPPPPESEHMSLEERLRWLLTPPIQELLRDPRNEFPHDPYKYQMYGIRWLMDREHALLADEMGLGKTMQAIIAARLLWREQRIKRILVVCPKTLIPTWREEIKLWWPSAIDNTQVVEKRLEWYMRLATDNVTIQIINYERLATKADLVEKEAFSYDLIIIDEAQRIKNPGTNTARAVKALRAGRRWALTGTPLENRVGDVVSIFDFVLPDLLGSDDAEHVRAGIQPYMLRRRTEEVLPDLPEIDARDVAVEMTTMQRAAYDRAEQEGIVALNEQGDTITVQHVFALITKLMQICNFEVESGESGKLVRLADDLEEIIDSGRKALVFSRFVSATHGLKRLETLLPAHCKSDTPVMPLMMYGKVLPRDRASNVKRFREDPTANVMLLNYTVGGTGLNLQVANYVYLFDRWWNPAVEDQAMKRVHRIGQEHKVFVRRFFTRSTIEERIIEKVAEKRCLFTRVIDSDRPTPEKMGLSEEEVFQLFKGLKVRPRRHGSERGPVRMDMSSLTPAEFEEVTARVYERQGFRVERRGGANDGGIDLIAERSGDGPTSRLRVAVQCKHYSKNVGPAPVRELVGVLAEDPSFNRADLVTSADFTAAARRAAADHRIELINGEEFKQLAQKHGVAVFGD